VPDTIRTDRLLLRPWRAGDAEALLPLLEANFDHLRTWIPLTVATPAPLPVLAARLETFAADFDADRRWRYCMLEGRETILGEVSLFPRDASGRVPFESADRVEIGYWLRKDLTGRGFATEATRAMIELAASLHRVRGVEIRCDDRNEPSAAIPRRLGFALLGTEEADGDPHAMIWYLDLDGSARSRR
jgi:RimJ/RimL family protein N-acetyltransferase